MRDPYGLIPPHIKAKIENEEFVERNAGTAREINRALKQMDPDLSLVLIKPGVAPIDLPSGAIPGRWHVRRSDPPPHPPRFFPITTRDGGYREPDFGVLAEMKERDLRNPDVYERHIRQEDRYREAREGKQSLEDEQRRDEMLADLKAGNRVAGEGGLHKRTWARGRPKGLVGS